MNMTYNYNENILKNSHIPGINCSKLFLNAPESQLTCFATGYEGTILDTRAHILKISEENHRKISYLRKIIGKYKGNNNAIIIVINTFIFASCCTLLCDVVKSRISK